MDSLWNRVLQGENDTSIAFLKTPKFIRYFPL